MQAISGLHDIDSGDITLRIFMLKGRTGPFLRLATRFRSEAMDSDKKHCEHEVCFDFNLSHIKKFEIVARNEAGKDVPDGFIDDKTFMHYYSLGLLERLQVNYHQIGVTGLDLAYEEASSAQKAVLVQLAQLGLAGSFTFYAKRKKAFRRMVKNMNACLSRELHCLSS